MVTEVSMPEAQAHRVLAPEASLKEEISLLDFAILLAKSKRLIFLITACFALLAIGVSLILPRRYTAKVTLLPPQQNSSMNSLLASQLGSLGGMAALAGVSLKNPNDMFVAMLRSRTVEDAMVQRYGLLKEYHKQYLSDARKVWESNTEIDGNGKDGLIYISVEDRDPARAAELANGYVDQFRKLSENLAISEASQRRLFFERQLEEAKNDLADAEEALRETEQKTGMIQLDSQARALIESAASLRAQITAKQVQIQALKTFATSENAQLIQAEQELESLRAQAATLGGDETDPDGNLIPSGGKVPQAGLEYIRRLREVKYRETIFDILARQFEMAKLDEAKQGALIQVVDAAIPPDRRSFPRRSLIVIGATLCGFLVGIFAALIRSALKRMREEPETSQKLHVLRSALSFRK